MQPRYDGWAMAFRKQSCIPFICFSATLSECRDKYREFCRHNKRTVREMNKTFRIAKVRFVEVTP